MFLRVRPRSPHRLTLQVRHPGQTQTVGDAQKDAMEKRGTQTQTSNAGTADTQTHTSDVGTAGTVRKETQKVAGDDEKRDTADHEKKPVHKGAENKVSFLICSL